MTRRASLLVLLSAVACGRPMPPAKTCSPQLGGHASFTFDSTSRGAWYLNTRFSPTDSVAYGIPVRRLDKTWQAAAAITPAILPAAATTDSLTSPTANFGFRIDGDFNHDGHVERAIVGVYRRTTGAEGQFLVILACEMSGAWKPVFLDSNPVAPTASFLFRQPGDTLEWSDCTACDAPDVQVFWDGTRFVSRWNPASLTTEE